jgi:SNF2 family DNA or RNA helicase
VLTDDLPEKKERVLFCELSPIQKELYQHILTLPDYILLKFASAPCDCGANRDLFQAYKLLHNEREKIDFQRRKRDFIVRRWECCWKIPKNPNYGIDGDEEEIDPRAPLWRWQHQEGKACDNCPYCMTFPALSKLYKLSSHASLLQLNRSPDSYQEPSPSWQSAMKDLDFARVAIPEHILQELPGRSYVRHDGIMVDHAKLSGKMKMLAELLKEFDRKGARLLLFSYSTQTLDMIQNFVKGEGYSYLRLDGSTPTNRRQELVDKYQNDPEIFLFLISTKAGGLGLNLTAANVVLIFDVDYNPSNDEQAQDRAYRIGQKHDVLVVRLVSRGTVEELKYIRQIYKVHLKQETIGDVEETAAHHAKPSRLFRAVQGDKYRKGELYGLENLLKYKDGAFMDEVCTYNLLPLCHKLQCSRN